MAGWHCAQYWLWFDFGISVPLFRCLCAVCMRTCARERACLRANMHTYIHVHAWMCACVHARMRACVHANMRSGTQVCVCVRVRACSVTRIYARTHACMCVRGWMHPCMCVRGWMHPCMCVPRPFVRRCTRLCACMCVCVQHTCACRTSARAMRASSSSWRRLHEKRIMLKK